MRIGKKNVFFILLFIVSLGLVYLIISTFSFISLQFKFFYELSEQSDIVEAKVIYTITNDEKIIYLNKKDNLVTIEQIEPSNVKPIILFSFEIKNEEMQTYSFEKRGNLHYLFYNNNKSLIIIDVKNSEFKIYNDLNFDFFLINENNNSYYYYTDYVIYSFSENKPIYHISNNILNIKSINFISNDYLFIQTYNESNYILNLTNMEYSLIDNYILYASINNNTLYYTYYFSNNDLIITTFKDNEFTSFKIKRVDFQSFIVKDEYMYLILDNSIQKVSLKRKKANEVLNISGYTDYIYDLNNIIIYNEKTMYLPMIYKETNHYKYRLYRYKV